MNPVRKLLVIATALGGILLLVVLLAFTGPVQTWVVRRVLASHPEWGVTVQRVDVGLGHVRVTGAEVHEAGAVLTLPSLGADLPLIDAAYRRRIEVTQLVARGWTLDLTKSDRRPAAASPNPGAPVRPSHSMSATASAADPSPAVRAAFLGVFHRLHLPVALSLDGMSLAGTVILPATADKPAVRIQAELVGGGLATGKEGTFNLASRFDVSGDGTLVRAMEIRGVVKAVMDTPYSFSKVSAQLDSQARGPAFPQGVQLTADLSAARVPGGESYAVTVQSVGKRLLDIQANYPANSSRLGGVWRLDMRDTDVAPFTLGHPLPAFEAVGSGMFETDTRFAAIHTAGRIKSSASHLEILLPALADVGPLTVFSEFDLTQTDRTTRLDRLTLTVNGEKPVMRANAMQSFEFNLRTGELKVADPTADLLAIDLQGLPVAWSHPFLHDWELEGGMLKGQLTASARNGGLLLRSIQPLTIDHTALAQGGHRLTEPLAATVQVSADYTPLGWQIDVPQLTLGSAEQSWLHLIAKAGQLARSGQPLKATGRLTLALPELLRQPGARDLPQLQAGSLDLDFSSSLGEKTEFQAALKLTGARGPSAEALPDISCDARATLDQAGRLELTLPLVLTHAEPPHVSDVTFSGSLAPEASGYRIDGRLGGENVYLHDLQLLAGVAGERTSEDSAAPAKPSVPGRDEQPFWHGVDGALTIAFKQLHYGGDFTLRDVAGTVRVDAGNLRVEHLQAGMGETGGLKADGGVSFKPADPQPYALNANVDVSDFDPAPLFKAVDPAKPPRIEGQFDIQTQLTAGGKNVDDLISQTKGDLHVTSKGGVFRLLSTDVATKVESVGKVAALGAFIGNVASALHPGKKAGEFANNAQAVAELTGALAAIRYDQLSVDVVRSATLNTDLKDFALIAPEIRLVGRGQLTATPQVPLLQQPLSMEFNLKARGRTKEVLGYLRMLDDQQDALGYTNCTLPLKVGGTLADPDTSEIKAALTKLALERSGAGDLLNKLLGK